MLTQNIKLLNLRDLNLWKYIYIYIYDKGFFSK